MRWQHRLMVGLAVVLTGAAMATTGKLANGTGNLSKARREALIGKIEAIKQFLQDSQDPNAEQLLAYTRELSQEVRAKKFGLVFEEHRERVDVVLEENLPIVREEAARFLDHGGELNFLIEGENLAALKLLAKTHRGKVDVIYIDPPYNTGNKDFVYNDCYVDANDLFRHSKWLSFMEKRLNVAKTLLSQRGVVFISIDDNEQATLKLLCDEIFGYEAFVATIPWRKRTAKADVPHRLSQDYEWVMCYAMPQFNAGIKKQTRKYFETEDFPGRPWRIHDMTKQTSAKERPNSYFTMVNPKTGQKYPASKKRTWAVSVDTFDEYYKAGRIIFPGDYEFLNIKKPVLRYFKDDDMRRDGLRFGYATVSTYLPSEVGMSQDGTKDIAALFEEKVFSFPKPVSLISYLVEIALPNISDALVLDFFAGSGTTGHAVMKLNAADGGKRRFILVTNNENGICERVTYERLRRVMEKDGYAARLKYLKVDYVPIKERLYYEYANELLGAIRELVELENGIDFAREQGVAIVQTDEELAALVADEARLAACRKLYKGHEVLMGNKQKATLRRAGIEVLEIPQYYYPELED